MKRIMAVMITVGLFVGLCSCAKTERAANGNKNPTLVWYIPGDKQEDMALVMEEANKTIAPAIGANLDIQFIDTGTFTEKMNMVMSSSTQFDICFTGFVNPYEATAQKGAYVSLNDLLKKTPKLQESLPPFIWEASKIKGEIYAVPNYQVVSGYHTPFIFKDIVEKLNLDLSKVKTMEDLEPLFAKIKENMPDIYPWRIASGITAWSQNQTISVTNGVSIDLNDTGLNAFMDSERDENLRIYKKIRDWYKKGYIRPDVASVGDDNLDWVNGKYAIFQAMYKPGVEAELRTKFNGREVIPIPVAKPLVERYKCLATMSAISRTSKNPEKSIKLLELVNTDKKLYNLLSYGIEGKHYEKINNKYVRLKNNSGYFINAAWKFGNQFNSYLLEGMDEQVWEKTMEMNNIAQKSPLLGFLLDTTPISSEISRVSSVASEYGALVNGSRDPEEFYEQYKRRMKTAGIENIRDEVQKQLDEYKKSAK